MPRTSATVAQVRNPVARTSTNIQDDGCKTSESVQEQGTTVDFKQVGEEIQEAIKDLPPSLVESELHWPEEVSNLKTLIEEIVGERKQLEAQLAATGVQTTQNLYRSQNNVQPPYYLANSRLIVPNDEPRRFGMNRQAQAAPSLQAHQNSHSVPMASVGAAAAPLWSPMPAQPVPQYHLNHQRFPGPQMYSRPSAYQNQPSYGASGSFERFQYLQNQYAQNARNTQAAQAAYFPQVGGQTPQSQQFQQGTGHEPRKGLQHNSGNQQNRCPQQEVGSQPYGSSHTRSVFHENNVLRQNSWGFQQSTVVQQNGFVLQNGGVQQNGGFQHNHGAQQSRAYEEEDIYNASPSRTPQPQCTRSQQSQASQQRNGFQSQMSSVRVDDSSHLDDTFYPETVIRRGEGQ